MENTDHIRNRLIDKILSIRNHNFLIALDNLISSTQNNEGTVELTEEQKLMLQMSEEDIANNKTISQENLKSETDLWLKRKIG